MHQFNEEKIISYPIKLVEEVILDIEQYPVFLPWCSKCLILQKNEAEIIAKLQIAFKNFEEFFISKILIERKDNVIIIEIKSISGPFEQLTSIWRLEKIKNVTKIKFSVDFKMKSKILDIVIGMIFNSAATKIVAAFEDRIEKLYK